MLTEILVSLPSTYRLPQLSWWQLHFSSCSSSNLGIVLDFSLSLIPPIQIVCTSRQLYLQIWNLTLFDHLHCYQAGSSLHHLLPDYHKRLFTGLLAPTLTTSVCFSTLARTCMSFCSSSFIIYTLSTTLLTSSLLPLLTRSLHSGLLVYARSVLDSFPVLSSQ